MVHDILDRNSNFEDMYYKAVRNSENSKIIQNWRTRPQELIDFICGLPDKNNLKILELGSGRGFLVKYLNDSGCDMIGSDFNKYNIKLAKEINNVDLLHIDALDINLKDQYFDIVISVELLEHLPDLRKHFREVKKILKPGGIYCSSTPNIYLETLYNFIKRKVPDKFHISLQSPQSLAILLKKEGFETNFLKMKIFRPSQVDKIGKLSKFIPIKFFPIICQPTINCVAKLSDNDEALDNV